MVNHTHHNWIVVGASITGNGHLETERPCQDAFACSSINKNWGIAVVSDGAGSYAQSQLGSKTVSQESIGVFKNLLFNKGFVQLDVLPSEEEWRELALIGLKRVRNELAKVALKRDVPFEELSCTVIVVVYSRKGLLVAHIGDGRATYYNGEQWLPMITPYHGALPGETLFITQNIFSDSLPKHIETRCVKGDFPHFALMSDGCESASFVCSEFDEQKEVYNDLNIPSKEFFDPIVKTLQQLNQRGFTPCQLTARWTRFLEVGTDKLKHETDDKTMVLITRKQTECTTTQKEKK